MLFEVHDKSSATPNDGTSPVPEDVAQHVPVWQVFKFTDRPHTEAPGSILHDKRALARFWAAVVDGETACSISHPHNDSSYTDRNTSMNAVVCHGAMGAVTMSKR